MISKRSNTASAKGRDIAPGVPAQKGCVMEEVVRSVPDGLSPFGSRQQAVSPVPASIPSADKIESAVIWCIEQAENIMATTAGCASSEGDRSGVLGYINSMASDIAINLQMAAQAIETRTAKPEGLGPKDESAAAKLCAQGDSA